MFAGMSEEGADLFPGKRHADCVREVRADTKVALTYQGLTGLAEVALTGGAPDAALVCCRQRRAADALCPSGRRRRRDAGGARRPLPYRRPRRRERDRAA